MGRLEIQNEVGVTVRQAELDCTAVWFTHIPY